MSDLALEVYELDVKRQLARNDARKIRSKVQDARNSPDDAGGRWPFELLQNACDAGARSPGRGISVEIGWRQSERGPQIFFNHDGCPFETRDLAALLSGGSSKDFDSDETTGRFGTGFLVTHVLAYKVYVSGLLHVRKRDADGEEIKQTEHFEIELDREGDEDRILASRDAAHADIRAARQIEQLDARPSAHFRWVTDDLTAYQTGIALLESSLPYVFATRPELSRVRFEDPDNGERTWVASPKTDHEDDVLVWSERRLRRLEGQTNTDYRIIWTGDESASAIILVREDDEELHLELPDERVPRIFRRFPLRGMSRLPSSRSSTAPST